MNASRSQSSFLQENVRRLREIQAKCRDREQPSRRHQPLRATTRVSSASTTASTLSKTDGPVDASLVKTGEGGAGRGDSAHSDYYSLSEDPPDPPLPTHPHYPPQGWPANTSSRPQSPVVLRPLATSPLPPHESDQHPLLPDAGLTREMRRLRMESLVSRISSQRPACEMDYHQHYRTIENQHRQLLDAVERINSSSGDAGSGEDSTRSRGTQVRAATPPRMVRAHSFDRSTQARRREGSAERTKAGASGELKALKKFHHRSSSPSPSSSFSSPQPARSSRIISKSGRLLQDTGEGKGVAGRQAMGLKSTAMTESISKDESRGKRGLLRAKSELGRASPDIRPSGTRPPSCHGSLWSNVRQDAADAASFSEDTNLNSTLSSSCDFYPGDHIEAESPRRATREDLKLAIRPDSQSTTAEGSHGAKDPNQNDWDSYNDLDFPQNSAVDAEDAAIYSGAVAGTKHSEPPDSKAEVTVGEKITNAGEDRKIDDPGGVDETDDVHRAQALATPTPVQHTGEDDTAAVATAVTTTTNSPRRLKNPSYHSLQHSLLSAANHTTLAYTYF
ncbi:hypothetical protein E2C01_006524 [Portunus trituberculatus]|uniref:Uncharacterized protein n=1 Tax=Portunus trituberculatus TaxID=210409 RepID=A0A5B7CWK7_PORTR|nr:hypothetical protein [Portunus trituberculatus]